MPASNPNFLCANLSLPSGINIPAWVNWIAQDADGAWWGYSVEPLQFHQGWYENELGERIKLAQSVTNPLWQTTLKKN